MKQLKDIITEKLRLDKNIKCIYTCQPKTKDDLKSIIKERLEQDNTADLNDIDVSQIIDMTGLFYNLDLRNIKIDNWNVSNVKDMSYMFSRCVKFNCDLSKWDISNVEDMYGMFCRCYNFNCDLSNWNVSKVKDMRDIFLNCNSLKNIPDWHKE